MRFAWCLVAMFDMTYVETNNEGSSRRGVHTTFNSGVLIIRPAYVRNQAYLRRLYVSGTSECQMGSLFSAHFT